MYSFYQTYLATVRTILVHIIYFYWKIVIGKKKKKHKMEKKTGLHFQFSDFK